MGRKRKPKTKLKRVPLQMQRLIRKVQEEFHVDGVKAQEILARRLRKFK